MVNAYLLTAAVFIILGGDAADRFGARYSSTAGNRAICFCVTGDSDCPRWMGRYRRACITRPWGGIRRSRHTGGGDRSIARTTAGGSDRYVDRLSDAWLQHWTADRGRNHPLCGLAFYFLVERIRHDGCRAYSIAPSRDQRPSDKVNGLGGIGFLAGFMVPLIIGLQALTHARTTLKAAIAALALAILAFGGLLWSEMRHLQPVVDFRLFRIAISQSLPALRFC